MQFLFELLCPRTGSHTVAYHYTVLPSGRRWSLFQKTTLYLTPSKGGIPSQHSLILGVGPYCGLTVHEAEVLVPEPPPLGDPVDRRLQYAGVRH